MKTVLVTHDVDDVQHWLRSRKRDEFFKPQGMTVRTFTSPAGGNRVGLIIEQVPDMETLQSMLQSADAAAAMKHDGVHPDSMVMLVES